jgi:levansucrase
VPACLEEDLAPTVRLNINGSKIAVDTTYGKNGLGGYGDIPANKRYRG